MGTDGTFLHFQTAALDAGGITSALFELFQAAFI